MKKKKFKFGDLVVVHFMDHCFTHFGRNEPIPIKVAGFFIEECPDHYKIETFAHDVPLDERDTNDKGDSYTILKHPSLRIRRAKEL